jgi:hypothetical protein
MNQTIHPAFWQLKISGNAMKLFGYISSRTKEQLDRAGKNTLMADLNLKEKALESAMKELVAKNMIVLSFKMMKIGDKLRKMWDFDVWPQSEWLITKEEQRNFDRTDKPSSNPGARKLNILTMSETVPSFRKIVNEWVMEDPDNLHQRLHSSCSWDSLGSLVARCVNVGLSESELNTRILGEVLEGLMGKSLKKEWKSIVEARFEAMKAKGYPSSEAVPNPYVVPEETERPSPTYKTAKTSRKEDLELAEFEAEDEGLSL